MRVGLTSSAGSLLRRLLLLVVLVVALPASAHAQDPVPTGPVVFPDPPDTVHPPVGDTLTFSAEGAGSYACAVDDDDALEDDDFIACSSPWRVPELGDGSHRLVVRAFGDGGVAEGAYIWVVDAVKPVVELVSGPSGPSRAGPAEVAFEGGGDTVGFECSPDGVTFEPCTSPWPVTVTAGASGELHVRAIDAVGNVGDPAVRTWSGLLAAPASPVITGAPTGTVRERTAALTFEAEGATRYECAVDSSTFAACTSPRELLGLADGPHFIDVRGVNADDTAGPVARREWIVDGTPPAVTLTAFPAGVQGTTSYSFSFSVDDSAASTTLECLVDGRALPACTPGTPTTGTVAGQGRHTLEVRATDAAGNVGRASRAWDVDLEGPSVGITGKPADPAREGRAEFTLAPSDDAVGLVCRLAGPGRETASLVACDTTPTYDGLTSGRYTFSVHAVDAAGNRGPEASHAWSVDLPDSVPPAPVPPTPVPETPLPATPPPATGGPAPTVSTKLTMLTPFPVVRIAGTAVGSRVRLRIFAIRAPSGTTVDVRCKGRGCPLTTFRQRISGKTRTVRVAKLERRALRAGTIVEVRVLAAGRIGKYTRLVMRSGAPPTRSDACVSGTRTLKIACPA